MGLARIFRMLSVFLAMICLVSCSGTKWIIQPEPVVDYRAGEIKETTSFVRQTNNPSPLNPVVDLEIREVNVIEHPQRKESQRYVQQYKLRPGLLALTLASSAAVFYVANAPNVNIDGNLKNQQLLLNGAGALLAASGFVALKPDGAPIATDERRLLAQTGTIVLRDTVSYVNASPTVAFVTVKYRGQTLIENVRKEFSRGRMFFDINREVQFVPVQSVDPGFLEMEVDALGKRSRIDVPVTSVMLQYVRVVAQTTPLRSGPRDVPGNVLADIVRGSQLKYEETYDSEWLRVLYGVASTYIRRSDVELIWRPAGKIDEKLVITEREANFGGVDIERDIPERASVDDDIHVLVIGNSDYLPGLPQRRVSGFNTDIVQRYAKQALGAKEEHVLVVGNPERFDYEELLSLGGRESGLQSRLDEKSKLLIYLSARGYVGGEGSDEVYLLPSDARPDDPTVTSIRLNEIFRAIGMLPYASCLVVVDMDYSLNATSTEALQTLAGNDIYRQLSAEFVNRPKSAVIFMNQLVQNSGDYVSKDGRVNNKYSIGTYFFVRSLKEKRALVGDIFQFMDNNINFTSRLLHDRAQSPVFLGDPNFMFAGY